MSDMNTIISGFVQEGNEKTDQFEHYLMQLEKNTGSRELVIELFRILHTIKGATGFLSCTKLCGLAHDGEQLLVCLRDGSLTPSLEIFNAFFSLIDAIREILSEIENSGKEGAKDYRTLQATLKRLQKTA
jgi:two-component system chemotaxis sensor kinase CheA